MLRKILPYVLVVLLVLIDLSVIPVFTDSVYLLPLTLIFVMCTGMLLGRMHGMLCGLLGGLLVDILAGYPLGYMMFTYVSCGYITGLIGCDSDEVRAQDRYSRTRAFFRRAGGVVLMLAAFEAVTMVYQYFYTAHIEGRFFRWAILRVLLGAAASSGAYYLCVPLMIGRRKARVRIGNRREVKSL